MAEGSSKHPWLTIVGLGEDGPEGLSAASRAALETAEIVMGAKRHLALLPDLPCDTIEWPVPFADGLPILMGLRGKRVVALASGDPFWFGAGAAITRALSEGEWRALPGPSTFALVAARLGWSLQDVTCLGLHAAPLTRLRPHLWNGARLIVLLRDGAAVSELANQLETLDFGDSRLTVCEAIGGPRERVTAHSVAEAREGAFSHPVCVAVEAVGTTALPRASGLPDALFETDGQITKRPMRALALSALAPRPFERLWDIGGGSGSIAVEWLLSHPTTNAISIEPRADRAARITQNAEQFGVDRLEVVEGKAPEALAGLTAPDAVFIGGGLSEAMLDALTGRLCPGTRLVAHAVTLSSEALLTAAHARLGGSLLRIELSEAAPLGSKHGWKAAYPVVQWQVTL